MLKTFDLFAESKNVEDEIMWKVYKWIPFIEMCMQLNSKKIANITATEIYKVGERVLEISVKNGNYKILETNKKYSQEFSELEFVRFIIGNNSSYHYFSNIFPLALDFNEGDMF